MNHSPSPSHDTKGSACGCSDYQVSRRSVLRGAAVATGFAAFGTVTGGAFRQVSMAAEGTAGNVLVVVSLRGGADGLSMVVPHGDPGYLQARPRIGVPTASLLARDPMFGLHPKLAPLLPMWEEGSFGAAHAIGLPQPNRSHFAAMEEMEDADLGSPERRGWLNRLIGMDLDPSPLQGIQLGRPTVPTSLYGSAPVVTANSLSSIRLVIPGHPTMAERKRQSLNYAWAAEGGVLGQAARTTLATTEQIEPLVNNPGAPQNGAVYPGGELGDCLKDTAVLIRADVGVQNVSIDYGSWDMHVNMGSADQGPMADNIDELASALRAFFVDLGASGSRVTVVTLSEFGRRVQENGARGLDHGYGNAMLLLGAGVAGGQVHTQWPGLSSGSLISGDLAVTRDYRSVLTEVIQRQFPDHSTADLFPMFQAERIGVMRA